MIKLFNTLTKRKEVFKPLKKGLVGLYTCGPTVYGPGHLGHARSYLNFDFLKRALFYNGYKVKHILNITDVHDDMLKKANELGISINELAKRYIPLFKQDIKNLNVLPAQKYPRVTEHISEIIKAVKILLNKGCAYVENDGSVYFKVSRFKNYGKLSGLKLKKSKTGTRVKTDKYEKENVSDFALWKGWKKGEPFWQSPWGKGRPGWHIECSVMAEKYLGKTIDIHAGAMDLKFPHHENEIAQSESLNNKKLANCWFHAGLLDIDGKKMSKSLGNYIEIREMREKGFNPLAFRYLCLTAHYSSKLNFTWESLMAAETALKNLCAKIADLRQLQFSEAQPPKIKEAEPPMIKIYKERFLGFINNDLDMPGAAALMWKMLGDKKLSDRQKHDLILDFDKVFGLGLAKIKPAKRAKIPPAVLKLTKQREKFRKEKNWPRADEIRKEIEKLGYRVEDTEKGSRVVELL